MRNYRRQSLKLLPLAIAVLAFVSASFISVRVQHNSGPDQASAPQHDQALTPQNEQAFTSRLDVQSIPLAFAQHGYPPCYVACQTEAGRCLGACPWPPNSCQQACNAALKQCVEACPEGSNKAN